MSFIRFVGVFHPIKLLNKIFSNDLSLKYFINLNFFVHVNKKRVFFLIEFYKLDFHKKIEFKKLGFTKYRIS